jgi:hypothetical protein
LKKLIAGIMLIAASAVSYAGYINDNGHKYVTKITTEDKGDYYKFKGTFPKVSFKLSKSSVTKAMKVYGESRTIGEMERNGIIHTDRKLAVKLKRTNDGLYIESNKVTMYVSEKELSKVKKK